MLLHSVGDVETIQILREQRTNFTKAVMDEEEYDRRSEPLNIGS